MDVDVKEEQDSLEQEKKVTTTISVDWLELDENLTSYIMSKLISNSDYARFGAVCVKWRSILIQDYNTISLPAQPPLLMVPTPKNKKKKRNDNESVSCSFYKLRDGKFCNQLKIAMPHDRYVRGSGYGWLITVDEDEICFSVQLMNPFLFNPNCTSANMVG